MTVGSYFGLLRVTLPLSMCVVSQRLMASVLRGPPSFMPSVGLSVAASNRLKLSWVSTALVSSQRRDWQARFRVRQWLSRVKIGPSGLSPSLLMSPVKLQMICILQFPSLLCLCVRLPTSFLLPRTGLSLAALVHAVTVTSSGVLFFQTEQRSCYILEFTICLALPVKTELNLTLKISWLPL